MPRPKGSKNKVVEEPVEVTVRSGSVVSEPVVSEKEQTLVRQAELLSHLTWLQTNKYQDIGQLEVALSRVNLRLTEL